MTGPVKTYKSLRQLPDDAEVLIEEARRRLRRRRRRTGLALAIAVVVGAGSYAAASSGSGSGSPPRTPAATTPPRQSAQPLVDAAAFHGHGELAFISHGSLWLLDGQTGALKSLPTGGDVPQQPAFSADGEWLSYATSGPKGGRFREWLVRANGTDTQSFQRHGSTTIIGWSPHGHLLAEARTGRHSLTTLRTVNPAGGSRSIATVRGFFDGAWSPDGHQLAVTTTGGVTGTSELLTYPLDGSPPTTWLSRRFHHDPLNGMQQPLLFLAGWWPRQGIGFWVIGDGMVSFIDQTPLDLVTSPRAMPRLLGRTLGNRSSTAVTASPSGWLALVDNGPHAFGRLIWQGKHVLVCPPDGNGCSRAPVAGDMVSLNPSWSPDGHTLAYLEAPASQSAGFPQHVVTRWYAAHRLALYDAKTQRVRSVPTARGASAPLWSADGRSLLYTAHDGIYLLPSLTAKPVRIATPLLPRHAWGAYYGQVSWSSQFAWTTHDEELDRPSAATAAPCRAGALRLAGGRQGGGGFGSVHADIVITNTGARCRLGGLPNQVRILTTDGRKLPLRLRRPPRRTVDQPVSLQHGSRVSLALAWVNWCASRPGRLRVQLGFPGTNRTVTGPFNGPPDYDYVPGCLSRGRPSTLQPLGWDR